MKAQGLWAVPLLVTLLSLPQTVGADSPGEGVYAAPTWGREVLTPRPPLEPRITGAAVFGVRPGRPIRYRVSATGVRPLVISASGLPAGVEIDTASGWISGRAPAVPGDIAITIQATNEHGDAERTLILRVGEEICLTPPMGWNSWYVYSEGVSENAIRETADAMAEKGLADHGWTYVNIDDCWMGLRHPETKAIQPNAKFRDMRALVEHVNAAGLKVGIYSTPWMSTYAGYVGGSAPNEECDYSDFTLPEAERLNPHQLFGRHPNGIRKNLCRIGPVWLIDRDAHQFADWGIDYVKYDWKEWTLHPGDDGRYRPSEDQPARKTAASGVTQRFYRDFRAVDRDIVLSLSPTHDNREDDFVPDYCNLWRLTADIHAEWGRLLAPFEMESRLQLTKPGTYGDLDMLQVGPMGRPNRADTTFKPSPLTPPEQYFQITLWCMLTQPMLLSCHVPSMDDFDINLVSNDEVLAINQDPLCKQGYRVSHRDGEWEVWAKDLAGGDKALALFNLSDEDQELKIAAGEVGASGVVRDLWRQRDAGVLEEQFSATVSPHGVAMFRVSPKP